MGLEWDPEGDRERRREGRARLWTTIAIVAGIGVFAVTRIARHQEEKRRQQEIEDLSRSQAALYDQPSAYPSYERPPAAPGANGDLTTAARAMCERLLTCNGLAEADVTRELDACEATQTRVSTDEVTAGMLARAYREVLAKCGTLPCDQFNACYVATLKTAVGGSAASPR